MNDTGAPGPLWMWFTAWSLQGAGMIAVDALDFDGALARFALSGLVAALPLLGLYWILRRLSRAQAPETT